MKVEGSKFSGTIFQYIITFTGCGILIYFAVWGTITDHQQSISAAKQALLFIIFLAFGHHQIKNFIEYVKSCLKN